MGQGHFKPLWSDLLLQEFRVIWTHPIFYVDFYNAITIIRVYSCVRNQHMPKNNRKKVNLRDPARPTPLFQNIYELFIILQIEPISGDESEYGGISANFVSNCT